jgi:hypothetical protein
MHSEVNGLAVSRNGNCLGRQLEGSCGDAQVQKDSRDYVFVSIVPYIYIRVVRKHSMMTTTTRQKGVLLQTTSHHMGFKLRSTVPNRLVHLNGTHRQPRSDPCT